ncbi:MAG: LysR family transcriptional regulator [Oscillospiraceae bacterium]
MKDIKLELYKIFLTVANANSFSVAAKELFMSQSAISQGIKSLETQLETQLFIRGSKGVSLSTEGKILYEYISPALSLISSGEVRLDGLKNLEYGELCLGASDTISKYILSPYLEFFSRSYPSIKIKIVNRTSRDAVGMLFDGKLDLVFVNFPLEENGLEVIKKFKVQDIFVAGERFKHLKGKTVPLQHISKLPLIFLEGKSNSRVYVENYMKSHGIDFHPEIELGSHDLLLEFAGINLGIACCIDRFSKEYIGNKVFKVKTLPEVPPRNICVCSYKKKPLSPVAQKFIDILSMPNISV